MNVRSVKSIVSFITLEVFGIKVIYFIDGNRLVTYDYNRGARGIFELRLQINLSFNS